MCGPVLTREPVDCESALKRSFLAGQKALDRGALAGVVDREPGAAVGERERAGGLQDGRLGGAGGQLSADQAEQGGAGHVGADRLRRRPGDPRQGGEGLEARDLVLDRAEDLLLPAGAGEVGFLGIALVVAGAGERERLLAVDLLL